MNTKLAVLLFTFSVFLSAHAAAAAAPAMHAESRFVDVGGLMSYGADLARICSAVRPSTWTRF
jgi:hypothetical protein